MTILVDDVRRMLVRELAALAAEIELFPDDETVWRTIPGVSNSAGNLALHLSGNLKHYIGAVLGGSGYVRDRDAEFSTRSGSREDLVRELREAARVVSTVLPGVDEMALSETFPEAVAGVDIPCGRFLVHLCAHAGFHLGQAGYLRRALTGQNHSAGGVSVPALQNEYGDR